MESIRDKARGGTGAGQLVVTTDGTIVIPRFGFGTDGDVAFIKKDGSMGTVPGLAKERRRIGLTVAEDGTCPCQDSIVATIARYFLLNGRWPR